MAAGEKLFHVLIVSQCNCQERIPVRALAFPGCVWVSVLFSSLIALGKPGVELLGSLGSAMAQAGRADPPLPS